MSAYSARRVMMVDTQVRPQDVTKFPIIEAMLAVPREVYVPADKREAAYVGENISLGGDRVMLEANECRNSWMPYTFNPARSCWIWAAVWAIRRP